MPSSVVVRGQRKYTPGAYSQEPDTSSGAGRELSTGNVALLGRFDFLEAATPERFTRYGQVTDFTQDVDTRLLAALAFEPSNDPKVPGGAQGLTLVGVAPTTRAYLNLRDASDAIALVLRAAAWGKDGARTHVKASVNAQDALGLDVVISRDGDSESYSNLQSGVLAQAWYEGADLTRTTLSVAPAAWAWAWEKDLVFPTGAMNSLVWLPTEILTGNQALGLTLVNGGSGASGADVVVTLEGLDEAGLEVTEMRTAAAGGVVFDQAVTNASWSQLTSITISCTDGAYNGTLTVSGTAFSIDCTDYQNLGQIIALIEQGAGQGFRAKALLPRVNSVPASPDADGVAAGAGGVDTQADVNVLGEGNKISLRADLWAVATSLATSNLVVPEVPVTGVEPPVAAQGFLVGGSVGVVTQQHWMDALAQLEREDIQYVVVLTEDVDVHGLLPGHCNRAALRGGERACFVGAAVDQTITNLRDDYAAILNSQYVSLLGQEIYVVDGLGRRRWLAPMYLAAMVAGAAAGTPPGTPLTGKTLRVLDVRGQWDSELDSDDAIEAGVFQLHKGRGGWTMTRSVTTWLQDANPFLSESSTWESLQTSSRDMRLHVESGVGEGSRAEDAPLLVTRVERRLGEQISRGIIKGWKKGSVQVIDRGDWLDIAYEVAPVEPRNFFTVGVRANRQAV